eukprot:m.64046 g.64046  ORF g.64046 m.64046 type:complete len:62 (-) comp49697_c0_seq2:714-899(-)
MVSQRQRLTQRRQHHKQQQHDRAHAAPNHTHKKNERTNAHEEKNTGKKAPPLHMKSSSAAL